MKIKKKLSWKMTNIYKIISSKYADILLFNILSLVCCVHSHTNFVGKCMNPSHHVTVMVYTELCKPGRQSFLAERQLRIQKHERRY